MIVDTILLATLLAAAGQTTPLNGYNVGLFQPGRGRSVAPTWTTYVAQTAITCQPLGGPLPPPTTAPLVAIVAEGFVVGLASEVNPTTDYCFTPLVKPPTPGDYEVSLQPVVTTPSGTIYGAWTVAVPTLHLQLEPVVACNVSGWYDWSEWTEWTPIAGDPVGRERTRTRTRTVTNPATGGGDPCPALTETERQTQNVAEPVTVTAIPKTDFTTSGTWKGYYGKQGSFIAAIDQATNPLVSVTPWYHQTYVWAASTTDPRALQKPGPLTRDPTEFAKPPKPVPVVDDRIASTWYSPTSFVVDVKFSDADQHQVAFYLLDFDSRDRAQSISPLDTMDNPVGPSQQIGSFTNGVYVLYLVSGHARFRFMNTSPSAYNNALVNGVFIDLPSVTPIACAVSDWTVGLWGPWVPKDAVTEERSRTDTRTVTTPPSGGGTPCPELTTVITESRPIATLSFTSNTVKQCLVSLTAPPPANTEPGWEALWYVDSGLFATDPVAPYSGLVQVSVGQHAFQVRWTRPEARSWWRRLFSAFGARATSGVVVYDPVAFVCQ